jgi:hypothetical protein
MVQFIIEHFTIDMWEGYLTTIWRDVTVFSCQPPEFLKSHSTSPTGTHFLTQIERTITKKWG